MKAFNITKKKRFKIAIYTDVYLGFLAIYSVYMEMEGVTAACVGGILTITSIFIGGDSMRKSE